MKTSLIFRQPQVGNFSIEKVFNLVAEQLNRTIEVENVFMTQSKLRPGSILKNFKHAKRVSADIFHITGDIHYMVLAFPRRKTILTIHDCVFLHQTTGIKRWLLKIFFLKWPVNHAAMITTISDKSRNEIIQNSGCSPEKVVVVPNPVGELFHYSPRSFNNHQPVLLFIGSTPNKNIERVIDAIKEIPCLLRIVGNVTPHTLGLLELNKISFEQLKGLTEQQLADTYNDCDIVLFPSTYEGFGLPIVEGQKSGRPVITSNISPMKDVAGEGACLVDPYSPESIREAVCKVITDSEYREQLVSKGLENVRQFEATAIADRYLQVYKRMKIKG